MFTIMDLHANKVICTCKTKEDVLRARDDRKHSFDSLFLKTVSGLNFTRSQKFCFDELNITGKDIKVSYGFDANGNYSGSWTLRRLQVLDEQGRSVDIRSWTKEMESILSHPLRWAQADRFDPRDPDYRSAPIEGTEKDSSRRVSGYAMWHQTAATNEATSLDDDDYDGYTPVIDHGAVRKRLPDLYSQWNQYERKHYGRDHLRKSWKDSSKGQRQWSKNSRMTRSVRQEARQLKACDMYLMGNDFETEEEQLQDSIPLYEDGYWD